MRSIPASLIVASLTGCVSMSSASLSGYRFGSLVQRDLAEFERRLAEDESAGDAGTDAWLQVAHAWSDLASCRLIAATQPSDHLARLVIQSLRLEQARRDRLIADEHQLQSEDVVRTWSNNLAEEDYFRRTAEPPSDAFILWLGESERWSDELAAATHVSSRCAARADAAQRSNLQELLTVEHRLARELVESASEFDAAVVATLGWRARVQVAFTALRLAQLASDPEDNDPEGSDLDDNGPEDGDPEDGHAAIRPDSDESNQRIADAVGPDGRSANGRAADEPEAPGEFAPDVLEDGTIEPNLNAPTLATARAPAAEWVDTARTFLDRGWTSVPAGVSVREVAQARQLAARLAANAGDLDAELAHWLAAVHLMTPSDSSYWEVAYTALRLSRELEQVELAASLSSPLPPREHALFDAYAYEVAMAAAWSDDIGQALRVATTALRDRHVRNHPSRHATLTVAMMVLATSEFDERTIELLEELGPRHETYYRLQAFAYIALDESNLDAAQAAGQWLFDHEPNARQRRRHLSLLALVALLKDDEPRFDAYVERMVSRPEALRRSVGRRRQAAFFREHDRALTALLSEALPRMVEWGDSAAALERRQRWLTRLALLVQDFLRTTPSTQERVPLLELYRSASAMLRDTPRGYAENVAQPSASLVLGQVQLDWPEPPAAATAFEWIPTYAFALLPRSSSPRDWTFAWALHEGLAPQDAASGRPEHAARGAKP